MKFGLFMICRFEKKYDSNNLVKDKIQESIIDY